MRSSLAALTLLIGLAPLGVCARTQMPNAMRRSIPDQANAVKLRSELSPASLYQAVQSVLVENGFLFAEANDSAMTLVTRPTRVGKIVPELRVRLHVRPRRSESELTATGEFLFQGAVWRPLAFGEGNADASAGYEELVLLIGQVPHVEIRYEAVE